MSKYGKSWRGTEGMGKGQEMVSGCGARVRGVVLGRWKRGWGWEVESDKWLRAGGVIVKCVHKQRMQVVYLYLIIIMFAAYVLCRYVYSASV